MRKLFENIEKKIFIPAFLVLIVLTLTIYLFPSQVNGVISILFSLCTHELGWLFMLTTNFSRSAPVVSGIIWIYDLADIQ